MQNRLLVNSIKSWLQEHKSVPCSLYIYYKKKKKELKRNSDSLFNFQAVNAE